MRRMTEREIAEWNNSWPIGSRCWVRHDDGIERDHKTRSPAWLLGSGHGVVSVDGISGGYALERVRMVGAREPHNAQSSPTPNAPALPRREGGAT